MALETILAKGSSIIHGGTVYSEDWGTKYPLSECSFRCELSLNLSGSLDKLDITIYNYNYNKVQEMQREKRVSWHYDADGITLTMRNYKTNVTQLLQDLQVINLQENGGETKWSKIPRMNRHVWVVFRCPFEENFEIIFWGPQGNLIILTR